MGIQGLLQFIKDASEPVHVMKYKGQTVAVDTYCWLHKGAFSCAEKLAKGEPTDQYVFFCMKFVDMLLSFGVKPILVFDGRNLPSKQEVEKARRERRQANLQKGKQLLREGKVSEARDCFTRSINITPSMAHAVIKAARTRGVDCVVAPYEADAQLAFLNKTGIAQAVITEDSDLLAFGCKKVILKMDKQGNGLEVAQCHLGRCRSLGDVFTEEKFRYMCILSGCDYLASLYGIGLGKACKLLKMANNPDILKVIRKIGQYLKMDIEVPEEYIEGFVKANNTFLYQLVFDPINRKVVPLNPYPEHVDPATLSYAGVNVGDKQGLEMALGNVDIYTLERIDDFDPDAPPAQKVKAPRSRYWNDSQVVGGVTRASIWSKDYVPGSAQPPTPPSNHRPPPTRGKEKKVSLQGLKLPRKEPQVKRPRQDSSVSEEDILEQYSAVPKRHCVDKSPVATEAERSKETTAGQPRARNRFATLLQWRNRSEESEGEQGLRSRFFASGSDLHMAEAWELPLTGDSSLSEKPKLALPLSGPTEVGGETAGQHHKASSSPPPPQPRHSGLGAFSWSGNSTERSRNGTDPSITSTERARTPGTVSGLSALHQYQRKKENLSWVESPQCTQSSSPDQDAVDVETPPASPPSQDSAYFSQPNSARSGVGDSPPGSQDPEEVPEKDKDDWGDSDRSAIAGNYPVSEEIGSAPLRQAKVSGLSRLRPCEPDKASKIRTSAPARASGLRKKPNAGGKKSTVTNENNPGMQATISGLWKNFGFSKENPKMKPCKKGEPMSPVKDNEQTNAA